jgi:hypothetical protein
MIDEGNSPVPNIIFEKTVELKYDYKNLLISTNYLYGNPLGIFAYHKVVIFVNLLTNQITKQIQVDDKMTMVYGDELLILINNNYTIILYKGQVIERKVIKKYEVILMTINDLILLN